MFYPTPGCCAYAHIEVKSMNDFKSAAFFASRNAGTFAVVYLNDDTTPFVKDVKKTYPKSLMELDEEKVLIFASREFPFTTNNKTLFTESSTVPFISPLEILKDSSANHAVMSQKPIYSNSMAHFKSQTFDYVIPNAGKTDMVAKADYIRIFGDFYRGGLIYCNVTSLLEFGPDTHEMKDENSVRNALAYCFTRSLIEAVVNGDFEISLDEFVVPEKPPACVNLTNPMEFFLNRVSEKNQRNCGKKWTICFFTTT